MEKGPEICQYSILLFSIVLLQGAVIVVGGGSFKPDLKSEILIHTGGTAFFKWDYTVDNKLADFDSLSPRWSFYNSSDYEFIIGHENRVKSWTWEVTNNTCPPRLLYPILRVNKISNATLVITNVTTADNGIYGCTLVLPIPKTSKMRLTVSVLPQINASEDKTVLENDNLIETCYAIGPPTPNVTWVRKGDERTLGFGVNGSAVLKIYSITRNQSGIYECRAMNNPNDPKQPVKKEMNVIVQFPVEFEKEDSVQSLEAFLGQKGVLMKSVARGVPTPTQVWFLPNKKIVKSETLESSTYEIEVVEEKHFGNWTINITNGIGSFYVHRFQISKGCTDGQIAGFVIGLIIALIIIAVVIWFILKRKKEKKEITTREKVIMGIASVVAVAIIVIVIVFIIDCA